MALILSTIWILWATYVGFLLLLYWRTCAKSKMILLAIRENDEVLLGMKTEINELKSKNEHLNGLVTKIIEELSTKLENHNFKITSQKQLFGSISPKQNLNKKGKLDGRSKEARELKKQEALNANTEQGENRISS